MNWYNVFYWVTVADGVKQFFDSASNLFTIAAVISCIVMIICTIGRSVDSSGERIKSDEDEKTNPLIRAWVKVLKISKGFFYTMLILSIITWVGYVFTPSKKDALIIIAGGAVGNFITKDSSAKQIPSEVMTLLKEKIQEEIRETRNSSVVDSLQTMSKEQLIDYIKKNK